MAVLAFDSDQHRETPVDLFVTVPFDFDDEYRQATVVEIAPGVPIRIVRLAVLLAMKRTAGRPQDLAEMAELRRRHGEIADDSEIDWSITTWEGNRRRQQEMFQARSFREKVGVIEGMGEVNERLVTLQHPAVKKQWRP
ncbi:MAG: hypothetical protein ACRELE_05475 [Gemmatimonadales bacterium]